MNRLFPAHDKLFICCPSLARPVWKPEDTLTVDRA